MVWGCIGYFGIADLCWIEGNMDSDAYLNVLQKHIQQSRDWLGMDKRKFIFQQNNARPHTALKAMHFFARQRIQVLSWPPNSPDLNLIENIRLYIKRKLDQDPEAAKDLDRLWERIEAI